MRLHYSQLSLPIEVLGSRVPVQGLPLPAAPLPVFGAVPEGDPISDRAIHGHFGVPPLHPFSAEDGVLVTVKVRLRHHQAGAVLCASVLHPVFGPQLHSFLLVHVIQDGVLCLFPYFCPFPSLAAADANPR